MHHHHHHHNLLKLRQLFNFTSQRGTQNEKNYYTNANIQQV